MGSNTKSRSASKVTLEKFDDLFGGSAVQENGVEQIINAPLAELYTFKDHPFRVEDDEKMEETTESIRQYGVLVPGIARPREGGGYEIIAGHRRRRGSELAGKTEMPVVVRKYTDDEATIIMVDSNIQREDILPSEKARAYKMKYEAMKHQGKKSGRNTLDEVGEAAGENAKKVQRYSPTTIHKYMNTELGLRSIVRPKKPDHGQGKPHKVFENKLKQDFTADKANQKWCTDFTYLFLADREVRYNCTIIDLHDRSVVASVTDRHITSDLAIRTLQKALDSQPAVKGELILHSDQGSQYTSKAFVEFCESVHVTQSMSKAGYPYDNAPMERYFNTLKNECTNLYEFQTEEALCQTVEEFAYVNYNHVRPHSFNGYRTPHQARITS